MTSPPARSKQFLHLHEALLRRLQGMVPAACYLIVTDSAHGGFKVQTLDERDYCIGRFQIVATWIEGYVAAWRRVARPVDAIGRLTLERLP